MPRSTLRRLSGAALLTVGAAVALPGPANPATAAPSALLRVAHLSPDAPPLEVLVDGRRVKAPVSFTTVSGYIPVTAGRHRVELRGGNVAVTSTADFSGGSAHTVAAMGRAAAPRARVFRDRLEAPPSGSGKVRVVHAVPGVPPADVVAQTGTTLFKGIAFAQDPGYLAVPAGSYSVVMKRAGTDTVLLAAQGIAVQPGAVYSIWAVGGGGRALQLVRSRDAAGVSAAPAGGVSTGYGGTAPKDSSPVGLGLFGGLAFVAIGGIWLGARRRS